MKRYEDSYVHTCVGCRSYAVVTSLFQVHNETINVWTHLLGAVVFVALIVHLGLRVFPTHYTSHVPCAGEMLMRGGVHTGHLLDVALFPPAGTYQTNCVRRCTPVPTLGWMREQLVAQSGASGPTGAMAGLGAGVLSRVETLDEDLGRKAKRALGSALEALARLRQQERDGSCVCSGDAAGESFQLCDQITRGRQSVCGGSYVSVVAG